MTHVALREEGLMIADDVLQPACFRSLCQEVAQGGYRRVRADGAYWAYVHDGRRDAFPPALVESYDAPNGLEDIE